MLRAGDSGAQTASALALPGMARMLHLKEEGFGQEATEDSELTPGSQVEDKDVNS